jgi:hypothetical protein
MPNTQILGERPTLDACRCSAVVIAICNGDRQTAHVWRFHFPRLFTLRCVLGREADLSRGAAELAGIFERRLVAAGAEGGSS